MQPVLVVQRLPQVAGEENRGGSGKAITRTGGYLLNTAMPHLDIRKMFLTSRTPHIIEKPLTMEVRGCIKTSVLKQALKEFMNIMLL